VTAIPLLKTTKDSLLRTTKISSGSLPVIVDLYGGRCFLALLVLKLCVLVCGAGRGFSSEFRAEAFTGRPFGVGVVRVPLREDRFAILGPVGIQIREESSRIFYPVVHVPRGMAALGIGRRILESSSRPAAQIAASLLKDASAVRVYFLFRGDESLRLRLIGSEVYQAVVQPTVNEREFQKCIREWWESLGEWDRPLMVGLPQESLLGEFMPYLECMLSQRLGLPRISRREETPDEWIAWISESEQMLFTPNVGAMLRSAWYDRHLYAPNLATVIVEHPAWERQSEVEPRPEAKARASFSNIEPIAFRVPAPCLYLRFGSYGNFVWFQDFLTRIGGDWEHLIRLRRWEPTVSRQVEESLALEQTLLARVMGPLVVEDVALLIGDPDFATGGTFGLLFKARNDALLGADLTRQRAQRLARDFSLKEEILTLEGRQVSFLKSPDGRVHSYYVAEDGYHLVSRSRRLVELFLRTKEGKGSLAGSPAFLEVRGKIAADAGSTVFVYAGPEFWEVFLGPQVRIERMRRHQALADIRLVQLALLAAQAEGLSLQSAEHLVERGFLPSDFGPRADGSCTRLEGSEVYDSLRGKPGTFPPVWDALPNSATAAEWSAYQKFRERVAGLGWVGHPVAISLQWQPGTDAEDQHERVDFEMWASSGGRVFRVFGQSVGEPAANRVVPLPADVLAGELVGLNRRFFWGIREFRIPWDPAEGVRLRELFPLRDWVVGYWGEVTHSGDEPVLAPRKERVGGSRDVEQRRRILPRVGRPLPLGRADPRISADRLGQWVAETDNFRVYSFHEDVLVDVLSGFRLEPADVPAQFRLHVADLSGRPIAAGVNRLVYARAFATTANHLRLFQSLEQLFGLPPGRGRAVAEQLLGVRFVCPLGGDYIWGEGPAGGWSSTGVPPGKYHRWLEQPPANFRAPPLDWFRGLKLAIRTGPDGAAIIGSLGMEIALDKGRTELEKEKTPSN